MSGHPHHHRRSHYFKKQSEMPRLPAVLLAAATLRVAAENVTVDDLVQQKDSISQLHRSLQGFSRGGVRNTILRRTRVFDGVDIDESYNCPDSATTLAECESQFCYQIDNMPCRKSTSCPTGSARSSALDCSNLPIGHAFACDCNSCVTDFTATSDYHSSRNNGCTNMDAGCTGQTCSWIDVLGDGKSVVGRYTNGGCDVSLDGSNCSCNVCSDKSVSYDCSAFSDDAQATVPCGVTTWIATETATEAPTASPTASPTPVPTTSPTKAPTTPEPTLEVESAEEPPTRSPVTPSPTDNPTASPIVPAPAVWPSKCDNMIFNSDMELGLEGYWRAAGAGELANNNPGYNSNNALRSWGRHRVWDGPEYIVRHFTYNKCATPGSQLEFKARFKLVDPVTNENMDCITDPGYSIPKDFTNGDNFCPRVTIYVRDTRKTLKTLRFGGYPNGWNADDYNQFKSVVTFPEVDGGWTGSMTNFRIVIDQINPKADLLLDDVYLSRVA